MKDGKIYFLTLIKESLCGYINVKKVNSWVKNIFIDKRNASLDFTLKNQCNSSYWQTKDETPYNQLSSHRIRIWKKFNIHQFLLKTPSKLETEGNFLNLIKVIYEKLTTNTILNGE